MDDYIYHYASPYYDPVKAHEYYMRRRQLKGRSRARLNDEGKEIWDYTKNQIGEEKKSARQSLADERTRKIQEARQKAAETRQRITEKLKRLRRMGGSYDAANERKKVAEDLKNVIAAARSAYQKSKTDLDSKYEDIYQTEYDKILAEYAKPKKKSRRRKKTKAEG